MIDTIDFNTVMPVVDSWDSVKRMPSWEEEFGERVFNKYVLFSIVIEP